MNYKLNTKYPFSELENISEWWQAHRQYDINETREPREYDDDGNIIECEYDDYVEIVKRSDEQIIADLRRRREYECFPYINRGSLWYDALTEEQKAEFKAWYAAWLNVTETLDAPTKPIWLK